MVVIGGVAVGVGGAVAVGMGVLVAVGVNVGVATTTLTGVSVRVGVGVGQGVGDGGGVGTVQAVRLISKSIRLMRAFDRRVLLFIIYPNKLMRFGKKLLIGEKSGSQTAKRGGSNKHVHNNNLQLNRLQRGSTG